MTRNATRIAVCGKGGTGKTVFIAMLANLLSSCPQSGRLLIIDADPAVGLPTTLGIHADKSMAQIRESVIEAARNGDLAEETELAGNIDYMLTEAMVETPDYTFLAMGRTESRGCYCSVNVFLRMALGILSENFDTILIDGEAGLEQINRQVTSELDFLIALTDVSTRGRETISHIAKLVKDDKAINCRQIGVVINRVSDSCEIGAITKYIENLGLEVFGIVPMDPMLEKFDMEGRPLNGLPADDRALRAVRNIAIHAGLCAGLKSMIN
jgi:CO dehydrogenase maturation factor